MAVEYIRIPGLVELPINEVQVDDLVPVYDVSAGRTKRVRAEFFLGAESVFDVTSYGADEAGDVSAAIQACINDASGGGTILFPPKPGGYIAYGLSQPFPKQTWLFSGYDSRLIKPANGTIVTVNGADFLCRDMTLEGASETYSGDNIVVGAGGTNARFMDCSSGLTTGRGLYSIADGTYVRGGDWGRIRLLGPGLSVGLQRPKITECKSIYSLELLGVVNPLVAANQQVGALTIDVGAVVDSEGGTFIGNLFTAGADVAGSYHNFNGNTLYGGTVTFGAGTSWCSWTGNSERPGTTVNDLAGTNNLIVTQKGTGGANDRVRVRTGADNRLGIGTVETILGTGNPEGLVTAYPGSIFYNVDGNSSGVATMYLKETGSGNTGWTAK